ncbi:MAG: VOC family protein [Bacteroidetes bacterium]|nr:VOC family protein [Bacteroidota bacterium]HET6243305.1 VOC family protein [Bacteroidia bacterium]
METRYIIPSQTRIGHIHLKVSDLERALNFYCELLGFSLITKMGNDAAFISAGGYHHHIGLNTWYSKNSSPSALRSTGLFHFAILYPTRKDLATAYKRLLDFHYPITGSADHGVSEAIYFNDPDRNGVELYWDRPMEQWPKKADGTINIYTAELDLSSLLNELV